MDNLFIILVIVATVIYALKFGSKSKEIKNQTIINKETFTTNNYTYYSKNLSNFIFLIIPFFLLVDLIALGGDTRYFSTVAFPTIAGTGLGSLILWLSNREMAVYITENKLIIKKNNNDIKEFEKDMINSYRISKDQGKTLLRIYSKDKSEFEISSYFLDLNGFEGKLKTFLI